MNEHWSLNQSVVLTRFQVIALYGNTNNNNQNLVTKSIIMIYNSPITNPPPPTTIPIKRKCTTYKSPNFLLKPVPLPEPSSLADVTFLLACAEWSEKPDLMPLNIQ